MGITIMVMKENMLNNIHTFINTINWFMSITICLIYIIGISTSKSQKMLREIINA